MPFGGLECIGGSTLQMDTYSSPPATPSPGDSRQEDADALIARTLAHEDQAAAEGGYVLSPPMKNAIRKRLMLQLTTKWEHEDQASGAAVPAGLDEPPDTVGGSRGTPPPLAAGLSQPSPGKRGTASPSFLDDPWSSDDEGDANRPGAPLTGLSPALTALPTAVSPKPLSAEEYAAMKLVRCHLPPPSTTPPPSSACPPRLRPATTRPLDHIGPYTTPSSGGLGPTAGLRRRLPATVPARRCENLRPTAMALPPLSPRAVDTTRRYPARRNLQWRRAG